jgi:isoamylase
MSAKVPISLFFFVISSASAAACGGHPSGLEQLNQAEAPGARGDANRDAGAGATGTFPNVLGARYDTNGSAIQFRVRSPRATHIELDVFLQPSQAAEVLAVPLVEEAASDVWSAIVDAPTLAGVGLANQTVYYGYRAWGPNWPYDVSWTKGQTTGFISDVDSSGNRFNPNKLLLDPYAREMSHDPLEPGMLDDSVYTTGSKRAVDSGLVAPKGIVLHDGNADLGVKPTAALKDDVMYEVHVRGFTKNDPSVPSLVQGTYAGAATKAAYLHSLGVTAIELLPVHESQNDTNDVAQTTAGANYWGYSTLDYFAPDRRYSSDKSPGGPTREFQAMAAAFHAAGIKVVLDVVYNHTAEGGTGGTDTSSALLLSWRGLDNPDYYELTSDGQHPYDNTGTGGNYNLAAPIARDLVMDSLQYWKDAMGVDGFRFDLAPVLGNACTAGCFKFNAADPKGVLMRAPAELPARPAGGGDGVDLIAEPWAIGSGTYQLGAFPTGWADWNGQFRDSIRTAQNELNTVPIAPAAVLTRVTGSPDLFGSRGPGASVNFLDVHDGFTLHDLYAYDQKENSQPWPFGPSSGGTDTNLSWNQTGDPVRQREAARTGLALVMTSSGVPLFAGGDEMLRTQYGNNNAYNLDTDKNWLDWSLQATNASFFTFAQQLIAFRAAHAALRPSSFLTTSNVMFLNLAGSIAPSTSLSDTGNHFVAWRIAGGGFGDTARAIYVAYNADASSVVATLPGLHPGMSWYQACDTSSAAEPNNSSVPGQEPQVIAATYTVQARSVVVLIEH